MSLTATIVGFVTGRSARRFEEATQDPMRVQTELLLGMVQKNAETEYGRRYGFGAIKSIEDYQKQVPVVAYNDIKAEMDRVVAGESNILTAEDPIMFAQTSGTTGDPKFIPVTPSEYSGPHRGQTSTWLYHFQKDHPGMLDGKIITMVSPAVEGHTPSGVPYGSTSGHIYKNLPGMVRRLYSIPYQVFEIADYQAKYYTIMRIGLGQDVRMLATANPSSVLKLCEKANEFSEDLIRDVRDGALAKSLEIEPEIRRMLESSFRPDPARARELEACRSRREGMLRPGDYWPHFRAIGCWKGGTVGHYLEKFGDWFDPDGRRPVPVRDMGYLSSEGRGSIPLSDQGSQGVLTVPVNFYEFAEVDDVQSNPDDPGAWRFLTVAEVEDGKEYYIFFTTTSGLYRYDINDVIRIEGRYNQTPQLVFVRKGRGMTNLTGEKLSVNQVIEAVQSSAQATGTRPDHFKVEADADRSRYVLRVEFANPAAEEAQAAFLKAFDEHLKQTNIEYKAKRESTRLGSPILHVMREGWYERDRKKMVAGGRRAFQAKTELLSPVKQATTVVQPELLRVIEMTEG